MLESVPVRTFFARVELACSLLLLVVLASAQNPDADPWPIAFSKDDSIGPDGPWWYIPQAVDYPDQILSLFPSLSRTSLVVSSDVCSSQSANCPLPVQPGWTPTGAYGVNNGSQTQGEPMAPNLWDDKVTALLALDGLAFYTNNRFTLYFGGKTDSLAFLDYHVVTVSDNLTVTFPGGAEYTVDVGLFSLYAGEESISWTAVNGSQSYANLTIPAAYLRSYIPSMSYGLHVGSVEPNITGSLVLGGYDSSRCITEPISSDKLSFRLLDISLNVSRGDSAFLNTTSLPLDGLLRVNGGQASELDVYPEPGVPYMYLPRETCDAIASHLPVTYNPDFNLYLWDTEALAYSQITSSPHTLVFSFSSGNDGQVATINVPFALLNLTLETPLRSSQTPYFPCSPWTSGEVPYNLGRAFLQAAFLGGNFQTNKSFLAQAPGPDFLPENIKKIETTDSFLSPAPNAPDWDSTWAATLKSLSGNSSTTVPGDQDGSGSSNSSDALSGGAIAGIVIGCIAIILIAAMGYWLLRRRKQRQPSGPAPDWNPKQQMMPPDSAPSQYSPAPGYPYPAKNQYPAPRFEMQTERPAAELETDYQRQPVEMGVGGR